MQIEGRATVDPVTHEPIPVFVSGSIVSGAHVYALTDAASAETTIASQGMAVANVKVDVPKLIAPNQYALSLTGTANFGASFIADSSQRVPFTVTVAVSCARGQ